MPVTILFPAERKQKNPQTRATKVNSEHHEVRETSSANAQRMRATNLPCHRQRTEKIILRIAGGAWCQYR
jgi:hypothetical protein